MEQKDYILREIEKIGQIMNAIAQKLFGDSQNLALSVEDQLDEVTEMLTEGADFNLAHFLSLSAEDAQEYISAFSGFSCENMELLAECIARIGLNSDSGVSVKYLEKALQLYELCVLRSKTYLLEREERIKTIRSEIAQRLS